MNDNTVPYVYASVKKTTEGVRSLAVFKLCGNGYAIYFVCSVYIFILSNYTTKGLGRVRDFNVVAHYMYALVGILFNVPLYPCAYCSHFNVISPSHIM